MPCIRETCVSCPKWRQNRESHKQATHRPASWRQWRVDLEVRSGQVRSPARRRRPISAQQSRINITSHTLVLCFVYSLKTLLLSAGRENQNEVEHVTMFSLDNCELGSRHKRSSVQRALLRCELGVPPRGQIAHSSAPPKLHAMRYRPQSSASSKLGAGERSLKQVARRSVVHCILDFAVGLPAAAALAREHNRVVRHGSRFGAKSPKYFMRF